MNIKVDLKDEKYNWRKIKIHRVTQGELCKCIAERSLKGPIKIGVDHQRKIYLGGD